MIVADSIGYIRHVLQDFGAGAIVILVVILSVSFRKLRWVLLPMLTGAAAAVAMSGLLVLLDWPVTVVSDNNLALLLIITLSLTIHLIVRYRKLHAQHPDAGLDQSGKRGNDCSKGANSRENSFNSAGLQRTARVILPA